jgi:hypothetical protein
MQRDKEQKLKELQEIDRELKDATDSNRYHYQPGTTDTAATPSGEIKRRKTRATAMRTTSLTDVPNGINDVLMIKFAL